MPREYAVYVADILEACRRIRSYTKGMTLTDFEKSPITIDAVVRNLEIIGEAAGKFPDEIKTKSPQMEWRKITALRNVLAHEHSARDVKIVWDILAKSSDPSNALAGSFRTLGWHTGPIYLGGRNESSEKCGFAYISASWPFCFRR